MRSRNQCDALYQAYDPVTTSKEEHAPPHDRQMYKLAQQKRSSKKVRIRILRGVIQLAAFLLIPGLFISVLSAIGAIYTAIITGSFVLSEQIGNLLMVTAVILMTFIWGRFFCGWLCSFGAMQDLLRFLGKRIVKRSIIPEKADRILKYVKYAVLLYLVIAVWTLGFGADTVWSPWTVFGSLASPWNGLPAQSILLSIGAALLLLTVIGSVFIDRFFCRYCCPLGAVFTLLSQFRIFRIKKPAASCGNCQGCTKSCPMAIPLNRHDEVRSGECIDCLNCTTACHRDNVTLHPLPAVSGTVAAMALAGVTFAGTLQPADSNIAAPTAPTAITTQVIEGKYQDGVYAGSASGYRGDISVSVTVENGNISDITVVSANDDREFLQQAKNGVIPAIIERQDTDVAAVSGATFSSRGIINAVEDALDSQKLSPAETTAPTAAEATEASTESPATEAPATEVPVTEEPATEAPQGMYTDGVYTGSGTGFRGTTSVSVTVENGMITDITVLSYQDDDRFFNNAQYGVIADILETQSVDVDAVSGATFSSNSIKEAVANALNLSFTNPNSSMGGGHGHH